MTLEKLSVSCAKPLSVSHSIRGVRRLCLTHLFQNTMPDLTLTQPNELLSLVFLLGFYSYPLHSALVTHYLNAITLVSWRWRTVAVDTARLWTTVLYRRRRVWGRIHNHNHSFINSVQEHYARILFRSKQLSLDVVYQPLGKDHPLDQAFLDVLLPHVQRCRTIHLDIHLLGFSIPLPRHLLPLPGPMLRLRELYISGKGDYEDFPPVLVADATNQSPLTTLHIYHLGLFDTSGLSSTILSDLCVSGVVDLYPPSEERRLWSRSAHSLTSLISSSGFQTANTPRVELPNLLRVGAPLGDAGRVPLTIDCFSVEELVLYKPEYDRDPDVLPMVSDIVFPWLDLRSLTTNDDDEPFYAILAALPTITSIACFEERLEPLEGSDEEVPHLGYRVGEELERVRHGGGKAVPNLETFMVEPPEWDDLEDELFEGAFYNLAEWSFDAWPGLKIQCLRHRVDGAAVLVRKELHSISERYPLGFAMIDTPPVSLEYLYKGSLELDSRVSRYQSLELERERRRETGEDQEEEEEDFSGGW